MNCVLEKPPVIAENLQKRLNKVEDISIAEQMAKSILETNNINQEIPCGSIWDEWELTVISEDVEDDGIIIFKQGDRALKRTQSSVERAMGSANLFSVRTLAIITVKIKG